MSKQVQISEKWLKASILGSIWAASEIVFGSFLHNLRIPLAGNILTTIGVVLLISISYFWKEKGLFWRAGLICALMKTMSPSAVIFGPMIAIFAEGLLMELSVRIFGRNAFGFVLAGILAMSWNVVQKIINFLIIYGLNVIDLYENLLKFAQKQLHIHTEIFWLPIFILLAINIIWGFLAAGFGIFIGKRAQKENIAQDIDFLQKENRNTNFQNDDFKYSHIRLIVNFLAMILILISANYLNWIVWTVFGFSAIVFWSFYYKRALQPLKKIKFWVTFVIISFLASYLFFWFNPSKNTVFDAFLIGWQMNLRAAVVMIGFTTVGKELYNPKIRGMFQNSRFRQVHLSLEMAFETLPFVMANIPSMKKFLQKPILEFQKLIRQAEYRLKSLRGADSKKQKIIIITGKIGVGKTAFVRKLIRHLKNRNLKAAGIVSLRVMHENIRIGYDVENLQTQATSCLARIADKNEQADIGQFVFSKTGLTLGIEALNIENLKNADYVVVDEIGPFELQDNGWAFSLGELLSQYNKSLILLIREHLVEAVVEKWNFKKPLLIFVDNASEAENLLKTENEICN
jgi:nucleoside-triphosphatase THEP1